MFEIPLIFIIFSSSAFFIFFVFKLYSTRKMEDIEVCRAVLEREPFFSDFSFVLKPFIFIGKKVWRTVRLGYLILAFLSRELSGKIGSYHHKISAAMHGRKQIDSSGCSGYWQELNECKNCAPEPQLVTAEPLQTISQAAPKKRGRKKKVLV